MKVTQIYPLSRMMDAAQLSWRQSALQCGRLSGTVPWESARFPWGGVCADFRGHKCPSDPPFLAGFCTAVNLILIIQGMGAPSISPGTFLRLQVIIWAAGKPEAAGGGAGPQGSNLRFLWQGPHEDPHCWDTGSLDSDSVPRIWVPLTDIPPPPRVFVWMD